MWIFLLYLGVFLVTLFSLKIGMRSVLHKTNKITLHQFDVLTSGILFFSLIVGGTALYLLRPFLPVYFWVIFLLECWAILYIEAKTLSVQKKMLYQILLTMVAVFGILAPVPGTTFLYWVSTFVISLLAYGLWKVFERFDEYPMFSNVNSTAWTVALMMGCLLPAFPLEYGVFAGILGVIVYAISRQRLSIALPSLGKYTSTLVGFIWAIIWAGCAVRGDFLVLFVAYGFYFMEMNMMFIQGLQKKPQIPYTVQICQAEGAAKKAFAIIFSHVFLLGLMVVLTSTIELRGQFLVEIALGIFICVDLYNKLRAIQSPLGSWRELFSDMKKGISEIPAKTKEVLTEKPKKSINKVTKKPKKKVTKKKK